MKIILAQHHPVLGNISHNVALLTEAMHQAQHQDARAIIFPEMAVTGYPPRDLLLNSDYCLEAFQAQDLLQEVTRSLNLLCIWGNIAPNPKQTGKRLLNQAYAVFQGEILACATKFHLPSYDVFYDTRYFEPGSLQEACPLFNYEQRRFALTVCEDLWSYSGFEHQAPHIIETPYEQDVVSQIRDQHVDVLINLSASHFTLGKPQQRQQALASLAQKEEVTLLYVNQVGGYDDLIYDGHSMAIHPDGQTECAAGFQDQTLTLSLNHAVNKLEPLTLPKEQYWHEALCFGIREYFRKSGCKQAYIGLSGGIDSALTATLAVDALGAENVKGLAMPGPYSSEHSLSDAYELANNLGITCETYPISHLFDVLISQLSFTPNSLTEQNIQARIRGMTLMTYANQYNALVLCTSNKSEIASGFSTLYGDTCGALAPIGDLLKTEVYELCHYLNDERSRIPQATLTKEPSAELAPEQKDSDTLTAYPKLDPLLAMLLNDNTPPSTMMSDPVFQQESARILNRLNQYEFKRAQFPTILKVSPKAFGSGRRFPLVR
jgi:NAD+ synthase (glutamine-hydrolysing)